MWGFNKKSKRLLEVEQIFKELDLLNLQSYVEKALMIQKDNKLKELKRTLEYLKPFILKALAEGSTYGTTPKIPISEFNYETTGFSKELDKLGLSIGRYDDIYDFTNPIRTQNDEVTRYPLLSLEKQTAHIEFSLKKV